MSSPDSRKPCILIGITGLAGSGKDTFAGYLAGALSAIGCHAEVRSLAAPLRRMLAAGFGVPMADMNDRTIKEAPHPRLNGISPRRALQTLGTEWGRQVLGESIWIDTLGRDIDDALESAAIEGDRRLHAYIIPDVRFPNEAEQLHRWGGSVIRILRPGAGLAGASGGHVSEQGVQNFDYTVTNYGSRLDLEDRATTYAIAHLCRLERRQAEVAA